MRVMKRAPIKESQISDEIAFHQDLTKENVRLFELHFSSKN